MRYVTGLEVVRIFADLGTVVAGRKLEDDAQLLLELDGGVRAALLATQIATGERNHLRLRVYGTEGGLDWSQEDPEALRLLEPGGAVRVLHRGGDGLSERTTAYTRLPAGHPEGFIEAFANIYLAFARTLRGEPGAFADDYPTAEDGARGVHFVERALESQSLGAWVDAAYAPPAEARS
jgi:predicted dehydrogenase